MKRACERIVFHVGDPKCGSTTIQYALGAERVIIGDEPLRLLGPTAINQNYLIVAIHENDSVPLKAFLKHVRTERPRFGVFSAELAATIPVEIFNQKFVRPLERHTDDFRVFYYVRDHASRLLSQFVESVKIGLPIVDNRINLNWYFKFVLNEEDPYIPYFQRYLQWENTFEEKIIVRAFRQETFNGADIVRDFVENGFDQSDVRYLEGNSSVANVSPSLKDVMMLRLLQEQLITLTPNQRHTLGYAAFELLPTRSTSQDSEEKLSIHRKLAERIYENCIEDARQMDSHFFAESPFLEERLEKTVTDAPRRRTPLDPYDHLSSDEIRHIQALAGVLLEMARSGDTWEHDLREERLRRILQG